MSNGSFAFCGVDISSLGLEYAPELSDTFVYRPADSQSHIESYDAHNGGYYYGSWTGPKEFLLRCIFEEKNIDKGIMAKIYSLFKVGKSGKLVFSRRPWCYYYATVTDPLQTEFTNYLNGIITVTLKAMYPFARSDIMTVLRTHRHYETIRSNTAMFDKEGMELPTEYDLTERADNILLVNPGTEKAALGFYISGDVGDGIIIKNNTTGQECKIVKLTKEVTTDVGKSLFVDPISGKVLLVGENETEYAFKYHNYGFLELDPAYPAVRDIYCTHSNKNILTVSNIISDDLTGKYIFIDGHWHKINEQPDEHTLVIDQNVIIRAAVRTTAMDMNHIEVKPITDMDIHIKFIFKPTYA